MRDTSVRGVNERVRITSVALPTRPRTTRRQAPTQGSPRTPKAGSFRRPKTRVLEDPKSVCSKTRTKKVKEMETGMATAKETAMAMATVKETGMAKETGRETETSRDTAWVRVSIFPNGNDGSSCSYHVGTRWTTIHRGSDAILRRARRKEPRWDRFS